MITTVSRFNLKTSSELHLIKHFFDSLLVILLSEICSKLLLEMIPFTRVLRGKMFSSIRQQISFARTNSDVTEQQHEQTGSHSRKAKQFLNDQPVMVERLKTRSVLTVSGPDSIRFLNNLTTNELSQLKTDATCVHTFFLNAKGRIIHDALIYRPDEDDTLFVECDIASLQALQTHLIMFRYYNETNYESQI